MNEPKQASKIRHIERRKDNSNHGKLLDSWDIYQLDETLDGPDCVCIVHTSFFEDESNPTTTKHIVSWDTFCVIETLGMAETLFPQGMTHYCSR